MNYKDYLTVNKFQQGGSAQSMQQQIAALVSAASNGDKNAQQQIQQIAAAAQQGDPQAQQIMQMIQQLTQSNVEQAQDGAGRFKCGGSIKKKAKVRKGKNGCACVLKKMGGRLIEIDSCTEKPIM